MRYEFPPSYTMYTEIKQEPVIIPLKYKHEDGRQSDGLLIPVLLDMIVDRLQHLNNEVPCRQNSLAITKVEEAIMWLQHRVDERQNRGVFGTKKIAGKRKRFESLTERQEHVPKDYFIRDKNKND